MNYLVDIIIIVVVLLFVFIFASKGFVASVLRSCSWAVSLAVTFFLYPVISSIIRHTFIFESLRDLIYGVMKLDGVAAEKGAGQIDAINLLTLPQSLKDMLVDNNNSVIYELLGVNSFKDYIAGYIANIILNIAVSILVFIIILIIIKLSTGALNLAVKLPVVKQINSWGGGVLGFIWGIIFVWVIMALTTFFIATPVFTDIVMTIDNSILGKILYDNNIIMNVLLAKLFGWG